MSWGHEIKDGFHVHQPNIDLDWSTWKDKTHWI